MANSGKNTNYTRHISRRVNFVRNGEIRKFHRIDWCEGDLKLADISSNNFGENNLNPRMKYIMVIFDNLERTLVKEGLRDT